MLFEHCPGAVKMGPAYQHDVSLLVEFALSLTVHASKTSVICALLLSVTLSVSFHKETLRVNCRAICLDAGTSRVGATCTVPESRHYAVAMNHIKR